MSTTSAPFGLRPAYHPSGTIRPKAGTIASGYATAIYLNAPVKIHTDGTLRAAAAGDSFVGSFQGCEYTDSSGVRQTGMWPASTSATDIVAYYTFDPAIVYLIQADGAIDTAEIGQMADITNDSAGNAYTQKSGVTLANGTSTSQAQLQVIGIPEGPDNTAGDTYTKVHVVINEHQFGTARAGF